MKKIVNPAWKEIHLSCPHPNKVQKSLWKKVWETVRVRGGGWIADKGIFCKKQGSCTYELADVAMAYT